MATPALPLPQPLSMPAVESLPGSIKAALPAITVMAVNGALDFLAAILILAAGWAISRWMHRWMRRWLTRVTVVDDTLKPLLANFARYAILVITLVAVLGQFGVQTTSLIALVGAAGLAIGLALQGTLSNVASGVMLLLLRPFRVHEGITAGNTTGTVREIGLFQTVLVTDDGVYVTVPNSTLFSATVINNSRLETHRVNVTIDVDYRADLDVALGVARDLVLADKRVLATPAPTIQIASLSGPAANMQILAWTVTGDAGGVQADYLKRIRAALLAKGIGPAQPLPTSPDPSGPPAPGSAQSNNAPGGAQTNDAPGPAQLPQPNKAPP